MGLLEVRLRGVGLGLRFGVRSGRGRVGVQVRAMYHTPPHTLHMHHVTHASHTLHR